MIDWQKGLDAINRDLAQGRAAIEELEHLKTIIEYWITVDPQSQEFIIKISRSGQISAEDFRDMVFNHSTTVTRKKRGGGQMSGKIERKIRSCLPKDAKLIKWEFTTDGADHYKQYDKRVRYWYQLPDGKILTGNVSAQTGGFR